MNFLKSWSIYLLRNERGLLYTGISNDPPRRLEEHRRGRTRGAKFTRGAKVLTMVYCCEIGPRGAALRVESRIKKLTKRDKETLVVENPDRAALFERLGYRDAD